MTDSQVDPRLVEIELTETAIMQDARASIMTLERLKSRGVSISIDDFGTGYSSLSYLKRLPLDTLKIDQSFVRDIATDNNDAAIVRAIIGLARSLGIKVLAEGVEDDVQLSFLNNYGCNYGQGFLFGRPLLPEGFAETDQKTGRRQPDLTRLRAGLRRGKLYRVCSSVGRIVRVSFCALRNTVTCALVPTYCSVSRRCRASMLGTGFSSHATMTSPSSTPASRAGLPASTDITRTPLSTGRSK